MVDLAQIQVVNWPESCLGQLAHLPAPGSTGPFHVGQLAENRLPCPCLGQLAKSVLGQLAEIPGQLAQVQPGLGQLARSPRAWVNWLRIVCPHPMPGPAPSQLGVN